MANPGYYFVTPARKPRPKLGVFEFNPTFSYSGGCILVAAKSAKKAALLLKTSTADLTPAKKLRGVFAVGKPRILVDAVYSE